MLYYYHDNINNLIEVYVGNSVEPSFSIYESGDTGRHPVELIVNPEVCNQEFSSWSLRKYFQTGILYLRSTGEIARVQSGRFKVIDISEHSKHLLKRFLS